MGYEDVISELAKHLSPARAEASQRFFKTGPGQYGEGDIFIGVSMPDCRKVCTQFKNLALQESQKLLNSKVHEHRMAGVIILANRFTKAGSSEREKIYKLYLKNVYRGRINNWDLVDVTTPAIVGEYLVDKPKDILFELARQESVWSRRVAVLATFAFIKRKQNTTSIQIAELLLDDKHDLIHKAVGWMLREMGKRSSKQALLDFLDIHYKQMPRTTLRYAIERLNSEQRAYYMAR